jgi:hypothetical protein
VDASLGVGSGLWVSYPRDYQGWLCVAHSMILTLLASQSLHLSGSLGIDRTKDSLDGQDLASAMSIGIFRIGHFPHFDLDILGRLTGKSQTHIDRWINRLPPQEDRVDMLNGMEKDNSVPSLDVSVIVHFCSRTTRKLTCSWFSFVIGLDMMSVVSIKLKVFGNVNG